jgi:hypothetical protein
VGNPVGWYVRQAPWFTRMFQDPAFDARVRARWRQLHADGTIDWFLGYIWTRSRALSHVQESNFQVWPILNWYVWPNRVVTGSYDGEVAAVQTWLDARPVDGLAARAVTAAGRRALSAAWAA